MIKLYIFIIFWGCIYNLQSFSNDSLSKSPFGLDKIEKDKSDTIQEKDQDFIPFSIQNINSVEDLFKINEKLLIDDLKSSVSKDMEEDILSRLSFIHSLNQYSFMMNRINKFDVEKYQALHSYFSGCLIGAPNEIQYDLYLQNNILNDIHNDNYNLYQTYILVLGFRKNKENRAFLDYIYNNFESKVRGYQRDFLYDALEFYNLQPAKIDISDFKDINKDEIILINEIFSRGIPGLRNMCDKDKFIVEDRKLNGFWEKIDDKWVFHKEKITMEGVPYISYEYAFNKNRDRAFLEILIWKGNLNFKFFIYRFDKINGVFDITGLWFVCTG